MLSDERIEQLELEVKVLRANNKGLKDKIDEQSKEIEELKKYEKYYEEMEEVNKKFIAVDKIKAKIEELEIEQESNREDLKIAIDNLLFQNIDKIGNRISINMSVREILQSLLEKE